MIVPSVTRMYSEAGEAAEVYGAANALTVARGLDPDSPANLRKATETR